MSSTLFLIGRTDTLIEDGADEADRDEPMLSNRGDLRRSTRKQRKTNFTGMSIYEGQDDTIMFEDNTKQEASTTDDLAAMDDVV